MLGARQLISEFAHLRVTPSILEPVMSITLATRTDDLTRLAAPLNC
jgi:hypothetical protein